jgi:hypothetical protein
MYWMSEPGVRKATLQINFGKTREGAWKTKKIDKIILSWEKEPLDFTIYSWYPGSSWALIAAPKNNSKD